MAVLSTYIQCIGTPSYNVLYISSQWDGGLLGTLLTSSKPLAGRVMGTLLTSSEPLAGRVTNKFLSCAKYVGGLQMPQNVLHGSQSYTLCTHLFVYCWAYTKNLIKQIYLSLFKHIMLATDYKAAVLKLYSFKSSKLQKFDSSCFVLKGGAPLPKQNRCPTDQQWSADSVRPYIVNGNLDDSRDYRYAGCVSQQLPISSPDMVIINIPLQHIVHKLSKPSLLDLAQKHGISGISTRSSKDGLSTLLQAHDCQCSTQLAYMLRPIDKQVSSKMRTQLVR